jgi:superfamily II RNA helicase
MIYKDLKLDRFQKEALQAVRNGASVIVAAPTGAGKTLIAEYAIERAIEGGKRIIYTAPIKAISNQKFRDFRREYGDEIGIMTGDVTINPAGRTLIMTTEIFRNTIFEDPERLADVEYVIFDEVHYMDDPERGTVWEESIIFAPPAIRFIALSATVSNVHTIARWIRKLRPGELRIITESARPVPLHYRVFQGEETLLEVPDLKEKPKRQRRGRGRQKGSRRGTRRGRRGRRSSFAQQPRPGASYFHKWNLDLVDRIRSAGHLPCIFFLFSRENCERMARGCARRNFLCGTEARRMGRFIQEHLMELELPLEGKLRELVGLLERGIAYHHAGLLPTLKELVERLFTSGLVKLLFATETFALGVNMPARSVAFENLRKFDGVAINYLKIREFQQMSGRAGRRGIDREGFVYVPLHPELDEPGRVLQLLKGKPEAVESQFNLSYTTLLNLHRRLGNRLYEACEKSFANAFPKRREVKAGGSTRYLDILAQTRRRMGLLRELGYLKSRGLSKKGSFAAMIYGFEIQATELFYGGLLERLDPHGLAVILGAVVFESRRDCRYKKLPKTILKREIRTARRILRPWWRRERAAGIAQPLKPLDFKLAGAIYEWSQGESFDRLSRYTDLPAGDLVRSFRLTIQLLRQLLRPVSALGPEKEGFRQRIVEAMARLNRDVVDAERQLKR